MHAPRIRTYPIRLLALLVLSTFVLGDQALALAPSSPSALSAKKCKKGRKGRACRRATKPAKGRISLTNCPSADLTPNVPYTFTGRVTPSRAGTKIVMQYFDQGTEPLARHTVLTAKDGSFSDTYAYPPTGIRRGGTVRANSTTAIDPVCSVTISEM